MRGAARPFGILLPVMATLAAMASFQIGAAFAKTLFPPSDRKAPPASGFASALRCSWLSRARGAPGHAARPFFRSSDWACRWRQPS